MPKEKSIKAIKKMVSSWLKDPECCLDRLSQIYGEDLARLERDGAGLEGNKESSELFEKFSLELDYEYALAEDEERK